MPEKITFQEFGMSDYFKRRSLPIGKNEPFFKRDKNGQLYQNSDCLTPGDEFMKLYKNYILGKK